MGIFKKKNKVFCIGANKTGTSSLSKLFSDLGYNVPSQKFQETHLRDIHLNFNVKKFTNFVNKYDFFQDIPFSLDNFYVRVDTLYPNSKFILTIRDSEEWYKSLINFHLSKMNKDKQLTRISSIKNVKKNDLKRIKWIDNNYSYEIIKNYHVSKIVDYKIKYDWSLLYDKDHYINSYEQRISEIIKFFQKKKDQLLIIDITKENDTRKLFKFLSINKNNEAFPHMNKSKIIDN
jgi:hypothetical protein